MSHRSLAIVSDLYLQIAIEEVVLPGIKIEGFAVYFSVPPPAMGLMYKLMAVPEYEKSGFERLPLL